MLEFYFWHNIVLGLETVINQSFRGFVFPVCLSPTKCLEFLFGSEIRAMGEGQKGLRLWNVCSKERGNCCKEQQSLGLLSMGGSVDPGWTQTGLQKSQVVTLIQTFTFWVAWTVSHMCGLSLTWFSHTVGPGSHFLWQMQRDADISPSAFASFYLWISISTRAITIISSAHTDQKHQKFQSLANCTFKCRDPKTRILTEPSGNSQCCEPLTGFEAHSVLFWHTSEGGILDSKGQWDRGAVQELLRGGVLTATW